MAKDIITRVAIDVRKLGASHSGSPLMNPRNLVPIDNSPFVSGRVAKYSNETVFNSNIMQNDDELFFSVSAGGVYRVRIHMVFQCSSNLPGTQHSFNFSGGGMPTFITSSTISGSFPGIFVYEANWQLTATLAGTVTLKWAQSNPQPFDLVLVAGSYLVYTQTA